MNYKFDFVRHRKVYFIVSSLIMLAGIVSLLVMGLNLGVDFKSGTRYEIKIGQHFVEKDVRDLLLQAQETSKKAGYDVNLAPTIVRVAGPENEIAVVRFDQTIDSKVKPIIRDTFGTKYDTKDFKVDINESTVNPTVGRELAKKAIWAVLWASLGIIVYVAIRFEYRFAIAAIAALMHDAFFVITAFSLLRLEVDLPFIAAVLTIVGYSVNDTIVIFDRIRENMKHARIRRFEDLEDVVNVSLNQTLARSINTVITVLITALALYLLGGTGIKNFSFALLLGLISGAYSSIFIASQIWIVWKGREFKNRFNPQPESR